MSTTTAIPVNTTNGHAHRLAPEAEAVARPIAAAVTAVVEPTKRKHIFKRPAGLALIGAVLIAGVGGAAYWMYASQWEETDDAFIDGNVYPVGTKVAGQIAAVRVDDNQLVKAGDVIAEIDARDLQAKLAQQQAALEAMKADTEAAKTNVELVRVNSAAQLQQAQAGIESAAAAIQTAESQLASSQADVISAQAESTRREADEKRFTSLDPRGVSQAQLDAARASSDAAKAQLTATNKRVAAAEAGVHESKAKLAAAQGVLAAAQTAAQQVASAEAKFRFAQAQVSEAQAKVDAAQLDLSYTQIKAPIAGRITHKNVQPGQYVQIGQSVVAVVPQDFWITANFKETQLARMRIGQTVDIKVDAFPDHVFHGHVESFQAGTGAAFSLLPPENATGNYVKVVQRVPVKILIDADDTSRTLLGLGMSVVPEVRVKGEEGQQKEMRNAVATR